ncbi:hypothetical protein RHGRI_007529 [Rhododendron griersonianum]|uniref:beta-N-acetylhexosaminidase n=1 Tax=Rhododendron griersonianum TaxID=479676 RepID=A0AAV6KX56_9ERIC|nr:hypothetical protein RHGRI_007529 [Rhododendron griersonianum]
MHEKFMLSVMLPPRVCDISTFYFPSWGPDKAILFQEQGGVVGFAFDVYMLSNCEASPREEVCINVMAEVDVPGHAESWGAGYPDLWPSASCREPLDVSKNFTFDLIAGILTDMRKIFPFELFHLGGDEVHTDCWTSTPHVQQWLRDHNMTGKDAYQYFVLRAQQIAISKNWTPVNW